MIFVVDKICNYLIYIFLLHFAWKIEIRKQPICIVMSISSNIIAGIIDEKLGCIRLDVYIIWALVAIILLFKDNIIHLVLTTFGLTWFMGMMDTFSVIVVQIIFRGVADSRDSLDTWQFGAYAISFIIEFLWYFFVFKRNNVFMNDISYIYKITVLIMTLVFEMEVVNVFSVYYGNPSEYTWYLHFRFGLSLIGALYAITVALRLAVKNYLYDKQNKELIVALKIQQNQYLYQKEYTHNLRQFRHDLINHIGAISEYLALKQYDNARKYINEVWNVTDTLTNKINTGDDSLDAILNYYYYLCNREGVQFEICGKVTKPLNIEMIDMTTIIGNALQNALEATMKVEERLIEVKIIDHPSEVFISIHNTCIFLNNRAVFRLETSKPDKKNHGLGFKNIISTIEKYQGEYYVSVENIDNRSLFKLDISLTRS